MTIHYEVAGGGPVPVVLLHGYAASLVTWHDLRDRFPAERYRLYLLDLKGHGFSAKPRDGRYGPDEQAAMVQAFIAANRLSGVILVGHSLGGGIALLTALRCQGEGRSPIARLILLAPAAYRQKLPFAMELLRWPLAGALLLRLVPRRRIVSHVLHAIFRNRAEITAERIERYASGFSPRGIPYALVATVRQIVPQDYERAVAAYRTISLPTLLVWGEDDPVVPLHLGERLHGEIPGSTLAVIPACGHNPHEERLEETWEAIAPFLDACSQKGGIESTEAQTSSCLATAINSSGRKSE